MPTRTHLQRLLAPERLVVVGGSFAEEVVRQCRAIGFGGEIWPVNPGRTTLAGLPCYPDLAALPGVPDAAFVSVSSTATVGLVAELSALGAGGVVCHASGFAEEGPAGATLQEALVEAAGEMALVGPNCMGLINYLDGAALFGDQHGGTRVGRGVAIISQSGNLAINLTMQRRSVPIATVVTVGNAAVTGVPELVDALLEDDRITAIGLHLEALPDLADLGRVAQRALERRVPIVVLKTGVSELGARTAHGHTSAIATPDVLCDALFARLGIARVHRIEAFLETLKLLHVHGALPGARITSASCSGGEAALVADLAAARGLELPPLSADVRSRLHTVLGERVRIDNPLDYHTYIWGDEEALRGCFSALLDTDADAHLLVLDLPRDDRCDLASWDATIAAYSSAQRRTGARACVVSSLPEGLPETVGDRLLAAGIAPMHGIADCLEAVLAARDIGAAQARRDRDLPFTGLPPVHGAVEQLDEATAKERLAGFGVPVPAGRVTCGPGAPAAATALGYPVVVKALSADLLHKTEVGGVRISLRSEDDVRRAVTDMAGLADRFLVERMVADATVELLVGVTRDPRFGLSMTLGAGGELVELLDDTVTLLLPAAADEIRSGLASLRIWPALQGRRRAPADVDAVVAVIERVAAFAAHHVDRLVEVEVNPLLATPGGAVAVDAVVRWAVDAAELTADGGPDDRLMTSAVPR